jgi:hypothetical protein
LSKGKYERIQNKSKDILQKNTVRTKETQRPSPQDIMSPQKSQPCPNNEIQIGPCRDINLSVASILDQNIVSILQPCANDILCGKGKYFFNHEGNKRFRVIVNKYVNDYRKASHRKKRSEIVKAVVYETLKTGARFLKKAERKSEWCDGGESIAKDKVRALDLIANHYFPVCKLYELTMT